MKYISPILLLVLFVATSLLSCTSKQKNAQTTATKNTPDSLALTKAWARPASQGGNSAAYLNIFNGTDATDTLLSISTDAASMSKVHESYQENGLLGMRPAGKLAIAPDSTLHIKPGSYHIMLMQINRKLSPGDSLTLTLHFSTAGMRHITVPIKLTN